MRARRVRVAWLFSAAAWLEDAPFVVGWRMARVAKTGAMRSTVVLCDVAALCRHGHPWLLGVERCAAG